MTAKSRILLLAALGGAIAAQTHVSALPAETFATTSALARPGKWVKIKVKETGVQAITYDDLRSWGFENPSQVRVYGFSGVELAHNTFSTPSPDDLPLQYSEHNGQSLYFYGEADWRTSIVRDNPAESSRFNRLVYDQKRDYYSLSSTYFLTDAPAEAGEEIAPAAPFEQRETMTTHTSLVYHEPEIENLGSAGTFFYDRAVPGGKLITYTLPVEDPAEAEARFGYAYMSKTRGYYNLPPMFGYTATRLKQYDSISANYGVSGSYDNAFFTIYPGMSMVGIKMANNITKLEVSFETSTSALIEYTAMDFISLVYKRHNRLGGKAQLEMNYPEYTASQGNVAFTEKVDGMRVWDVSTPLSVRPLTIGKDAEGNPAVTPASEGTVRLVAFNPEADGLGKPEYVETLPAFARNLHSLDGDIDMLIVTTDPLLDDANRIARAHTLKQGLNVEVVRTADIFNEFSSGNYSAIAIHRFAKMLYDRGNRRLSSILLMGTGSWDNRGITMTVENTLPTYQVEEWRDNPKGWIGYNTTNFSTDNYFGMLADDFNPAEMLTTKASVAVGRIPDAAATVMAGKIEAYLDNWHDAVPRSRAVMVADYADGDAHVIMSENNYHVLDSVMPGILTSKIYGGCFYNHTKADASSNRLAEAMAASPGYIGYCGHGSTTSVGSNMIWSIYNSDMFRFTSYPVVFFASCNVLSMDRPGESFGETVLSRYNPGPVAVISSCRTVYLDFNVHIYNCFTESWYNNNAGSNPTIGSLWLDAFNNVIERYYDDEPEAVLNALCYNLGGDPALPVAAGRLHASLSAVNGKAPVADSPAQVTALQPVTFEGYITETDGSIAADFNGSIVATLLDGATREQTHDNYDAEVKPSFDINDRIIASASAQVVNGRWQATLTPPLPLVDSNVNSLVIAATEDADNGRRVAIETINAIDIVEPEDVAEAGEAQGPEIVSMYLDDESFVDGDAMPNNVTLHAVIAPREDGAGIAMAMGRIGSRAYVTLDGTYSYPTIGNSLLWANDGSGSASLTLPLTGLSDGHHTIELSVSDNAGNVTKRLLGFVVVDNESYTGTLSSSATLVDTGLAEIEATIPSSATLSRLVIEDAAGETVATFENPTMPLQWATDGLPDGLYRVMGWIKGDKRWGRTNALQLTVINPSKK